MQQINAFCIFVPRFVNICSISASGTISRADVTSGNTHLHIDDGDLNHISKSSKEVAFYSVIIYNVNSEQFREIYKVSKKRCHFGGIVTALSPSAVT